MRRHAIVAVAVVILLLVVSQVLIPTVGEGTVEGRLTENGGEAQVTLEALPALRLLLGDGDRFEVDASGLDLELDPRERVFERLDGFSVIDVTISDFTAGPFEMERFELSREGDPIYRMTASGEASAGGLAELGAETVDLPGGSFLDTILGGPLPTPAVPIDLDMELSSEDGRVQVVSGGGTVAGVTVDPLAQLITEVIVSRL